MRYQPALKLLIAQHIYVHHNEKSPNVRLGALPRAMVAHDRIMRVVYLYVRMKLGYDRHQEGSTFVAFSQSYEQRVDTPPQTKRTRIQLDGPEPTYALL